jgi:acyl carrier protein
MTEHEVRTLIVEAMNYANVAGMRDLDMITLFLEGSEDIDFDQLGMDSLATMELCIAIEDKTGVSIVPDEMQKFGTLNHLVKSVQDQSK